MKISYKYLANHVALGDMTPEKLAGILTFAGAEVEEVTHFASGTNLVIGKILSCANHPDSDHLHILQVDEGGKHGIHQIVCGAPNAKEGLKVIVARDGAELPGGTIKPSKIRGVDSDGMCCSLLELGVDRKFLTDYQCSGIEELPEDAPVGEEDVLGYLGLDDVALDISILPNRPDLYAFENVVREVACLLNAEADIPAPKEVELPASDFVVGSATSKCPLFSGRVVRNVKTHASPAWLKQILETSGIRSINNIVDIGNYIMLLTGQPLNMYDLDKLPKKELIVRDDLEGEFLAMDGNSYPLHPGDLVVTSDGQPMCLAGIMTADACRVDENTVNIVVEAAYFDYASIRHTSNRIGLSSDSSLRFCKGINPDQAEYVQQKTSDALVELAEASEVETTVLYDVYPHKTKVIETTAKYIDGRLGTSFGEDLIVETLRRDHMNVTVDNGVLRVEVPSYRIDMDGEADVSEEVIRILGFSNITSSLPITRLSLLGLTPIQQKKEDVRHYLLAHGMNEIVTYTLVSKASAARFRYLGHAEPYCLKNPMTVEREVVRPSLMPSVLETASYNFAHQNKDFALFEISDIDAKGFAGRYLSMVLCGNAKDQGRIGERPYDFYDAKGYVEGIMTVLGIQPTRYSYVPWSMGGNEMHPGRSAEIRVGKKVIGYLGELHPKALKAYGLKGAVVVAEIDFGALCDMKMGAPKGVIPPKFPRVFRDLAPLVDRKVTYEEIRKELLRSSALIHSVEVFDVYDGKGIPEGKKSIALTLCIGLDERTLQEAEINEAVNKAINVLKCRFGAEIRGE